MGEYWTMPKLLEKRYGKKEGKKRYDKMKKSFPYFMKEQYSTLAWVATNKKKLVKK